MAVWSLEKGNLKLQEYKNLTYLQESIRIMRSALSQFGYHFFLTTRPDSIAISFNGGKDCTVLLFIYTVLENQYRLEHHLPRRPIRALYVKGPNPFPEVEEFIEKCKREYSRS
jgi:FAD synthetase